MIEVAGVEGRGQFLVVLNWDSVFPKIFKVGEKPLIGNGKTLV